MRPWSTVILLQLKKLILAPLKGVVHSRHRNIFALHIAQNEESVIDSLALNRL
jgi:hypothetical protein